jgi:hypothetical protein
MKFYRLILIPVFTLNVAAQDVSFPLSVGDRWQYGNINPGYPTYRVEYQVISDSVMPNGHKYAVFNQTFVGARYFRQDGNQIYLYNAADTTEYLLYDFSRSVGDTIGRYVAAFDTFVVVLDDSGKGTFWGIQHTTWSFSHRIQHLTDGSNSTFLVDSLGVYSYTLDTDPYYFGGAVISGKTYGTILGVSRASAQMPSEPILYQNFPNPFNGSTVIRYFLPTSAEVRLEVFDLLGRKVSTLTHATQNPGTYTADFHSGSLASGIYLVRLTIGSNSQSRPVVLLK